MGLLNRLELAWCSRHGHEGIAGRCPSVTVQLSCTGGVQNRFGKLHQREVQPAKVLANVGVGTGFAEQDRAEYLPVLVSEVDPIRQTQQRASHVSPDCDPGEAGYGMPGESLGKQRSQQVYLAREEVEKQPLGYDRSTSDARGGCRIEAVCGQEIFGGVKNAFTRLTATPDLFGTRRFVVNTERVLGDEGARLPGTCSASARHRNSPL